MALARFPRCLRRILSAGAYARAGMASATRRAYRSDFARFRNWCDQRNVSPLPASSDAVAAFLAFEADSGMDPSTIVRRIASIRHAHRLAGLPSPTGDERVRATARGITRSRSSAPRRKTAATVDMVMAMVPAKSGRLSDVRDRALLLIGFAGAFRRSELVALDLADIEETTDGLRINIRQSKTDQQSRGALIAIPRGAVACPVTAFRAWVTAAGLISGAVFRPISKGQRVQERRLTDRGLVKVIKRHAARVGLDPREFAGHSLRRGFLTETAARGANLFRMADQSRHSSIETLRGYVQVAELFKDHPGSGLL
jgi:site-specific recombinase XerD